jgi:hypothetical protein
LSPFGFLSVQAFMRRTIGASLLAAFAVAVSLTGCSAGPLSDSLKQMPESLGGLPPDAPRTPAMPYQYPPVHDMPPPRADEPLSEDRQWQLEKELNAARDRQEAVNPAAQKAAEVAKKKPAPAKTGQNAGASTGTKTNP